MSRGIAVPLCPVAFARVLAYRWLPLRSQDPHDLLATSQLGVGDALPRAGSFMWGGRIVFSRGLGPVVFVRLITSQPLLNHESASAKLLSSFRHLSRFRLRRTDLPVLIAQAAIATLPSIKHRSTPPLHRAVCWTEPLSR